MLSHTVVACCFHCKTPLAVSILHSEDILKMFALSALVFQLIRQELCPRAGQPLQVGVFGVLERGSPFIIPHHAVTK